MKYKLRYLVSEDKESVLIGDINHSKSFVEVFNENGTISKTKLSIEFHGSWYCPTQKYSPKKNKYYKTHTLKTMEKYYPDILTKIHSALNISTI